MKKLLFVLAIIIQGTVVAQLNKINYTIKLEGKDVYLSKDNYFAKSIFFVMERKKNYVIVENVFDQRFKIKTPNNLTEDNVLWITVAGVNEANSRKLEMKHVHRVFTDWDEYFAYNKTVKDKWIKLDI